MSELTITLPDGSTRVLPEGATGADLAADIGSGLARAALIVTVDGDSRDLDRVLPDGCSVSIVTTDRHVRVQPHTPTNAHVLAQTVPHTCPRTN